MIDGQGRIIDYLRISVTDRCNLRCVYCMPEEGMKPVSHDEILRYQEVERLARIFARLGIRKIKITGGEPLVRKGIENLVKNLKRTPGIEQVTITTNGILLGEKLEVLKAAGLDGMNLSLDTLNPKIYRQITRREGLEKALEGIKKTLEDGQIPLKINCVPMGIPGQEVEELAKLSQKYPVHVRYIEMMPIGLGKNYQSVKEEHILENLEAIYGKARRYEGKLGNGPGHYYEFPGFAGKIGFISAISHKFCGECNRVRLTSQGFLKTCLQYEAGVDLRQYLRSGMPEEQLEQMIRKEILCKPTSHHFLQGEDEKTEHRTMSQIGG